jgi:hypothetical protein
MPAFYSASISEFLAQHEDLIVGRLSNIVQQGFSELSAKQLDAWRLQVPILRTALRADYAEDWHLFLEYPMPRRGKRIDGVILAGNVILVIEFKCGAELDWTGVCWDIDLVPELDQWRVQAFKGTKWQVVRNPTTHQYVLNKYRVLLTRAREGMIIWVPRGDKSDWTRAASRKSNAHGAESDQ